MRLIFAGTPAFAATALAALVAAGHDILLVLTQPDRPSGRGLRLEASAVKKYAQKQCIAVEQPLTLKVADVHVLLANARADAMIVAAYGLILPQQILAIPKLGCINIHASLLPRWRGAAPIQRAILAGDATTGITIMQMDQGLDTGGILLQRAIPIGADETAGELHDRLAILGAQLINEALNVLPAPVSQDDARACYAAKISKAEAMINWNEDATTIHRKIRAFNPFPGAVSVLGGERIKIWHAQPAAGDRGAAPGTVRASPSPAGHLSVSCGSGALSILELQRAGGKRLSAAAFLAGFPVAAGARFDS
jgi:methionyl-tRNA formyltransferase